MDEDFNLFDAIAIIDPQAKYGTQLLNGNLAIRNWESTVHPTTPTNTELLQAWTQRQAEIAGEMEVVLSLPNGLELGPQQSTPFVYPSTVRSLRTFQHGYRMTFRSNLGERWGRDVLLTRLLASWQGTASGGFQITRNSATCHIVEFQSSSTLDIPLDIRFAKLGYLGVKAAQIQGTCRYLMGQIYYREILAEPPAPIPQIPAFPGFPPGTPIAF